MKKLWLVLLLIIVFQLFAQTRKPAVSGRWYPKEKTELLDLLNELFGKVDLPEEQQDIEPFGIISPHAGFIYSGKTAAYGYSLLAGKHYDTIILLGTSHHFLKGVISVYDGDFYETPFGKIPIDKEITGEILRFAGTKFQPEIHEPEHSLEAQLPFLQYHLDNFMIVPILTSTQDSKQLEEFAHSLSNLIKKSDKKILLICSTDMSHYHKYNEAKKMDERTIESICSEEWEKLANDIRNGKSELCGHFALRIFSQVMNDFDMKKSFLHYENSGDAVGDTKSKSVVGYCSIVYYKEDEMENEFLNDEEKKYLLELARRSIEYRLSEHKKLQPEKPDDPVLSEELAVFVTLNKQEQLRGCIGQLTAQEPLYMAVSNMANSAAFNDYRFSSVAETELDDIKIEISVLTPLQQIDDIEKIRMGIDGVWIKKGYHSGVFLPQVATETGWDRITFLENLCSHKAGLARGAYLDKDVEIYIFQVLKFKEE